MNTQEAYMDPEERQPIVVQGNVPAFLLKLWKIVEDSSCDHLISWSQNGKAFKVHDQTEFSREILPRFYKHNNFSSFVRQVNMYGFRKIVDTQSGNLRLEREEWEFGHSNFQKGKSDELHLIKRKVHHKGESKVAVPQLIPLLQDVDKLKKDAEEVNQKLDMVKSENGMLWRQVADLREQHHNQQNVINKLIQFFVQLVMGKTDITRKRRAIDYPSIPPSKISKSQELQPYNPSTLDISALLPEETIYTVQSPLSPADDRVSEMSPASLKVLEEAPPQSPELPVHDNLDDLKCAVAGFETPPNVDTSESPFVFPDKYAPNLTHSEIGNRSTLSTPVLSIPEETLASNQIKSSRNTTDSSTLSTPALSVTPAFNRQQSFSDRSEISQDVEKISESINILQDLLLKKKINIDLKKMDLLPLYSSLPTQVSVQDLIRMGQPNYNYDDVSSPVETTSALTDETSTKGLADENTNSGQLMPYVSPFSPSQLLNNAVYNEDNVNVSSDFFDSVLEE